MSTPTSCNQQKRQRALLSSDKSQCPFKKRKLSCTNRQTRQPAEYWDNLSKIWLTESALDELKRRGTQNTRGAKCSQKPQSRKHSSCRTLAELRESDEEAIQPVAEYLRDSTQSRLRDIKLFARRGGPDLRNLRGVRN